MKGVFFVIDFILAGMLTLLPCRDCYFFHCKASLPAAFEVFKSSVQWVFVRSPQSWGFPYAGVLESFCNWVDEIKVSFVTLTSLSLGNNGKSNFGVVLFVGMTRN